MPVLLARGDHRERYIIHRVGEHPPTRRGEATTEQTEDTAANPSVPTGTSGDLSAADGTLTHNRTGGVRGPPGTT